MKPEYIKRFEKLGFGMFVHLGLYSILGYYYAVIKDVLMSANPNAQLEMGTSKVTIPTHKIRNARYLDCKDRVILSKDKHTITVQPFNYGEARAVRVVRFK